MSHSIVVMGVSGSGKTTVGERLAGSLSAEFIDADWLHSRDNLETMAAIMPYSTPLWTILTKCPAPLGPQCR